jgi:TonB family protein
VTVLNNPASAEWILNLSLHFLLVLVLSRAAGRLAGRRSAPLRSGICLAAMAAVVVLPLVTASLNTLPRPLYRTASIEVEVTQTINHSSSGDNVMLTAGVQRPPEAVRPLLNAEMGQSGRGAAPIFKKKAPIYIGLLNAFGLIWLAGFILLFGRLIGGIISARALQKTGTPASDGRLAYLLDRNEKSFGKILRVSILESKFANGPMAVGLFRPKILFPAGCVQRMADSEISGILLHELSHIFHRDQLKGILQRIFTAFAWWNPLTYKISAEFSRAREEISDTHVLLYNDSKEYARSLIGLAEWTGYLHMPVFALSSSHIPLKERVKNILSKERNMDTKLKTRTVALILTTACLCLFMIAGGRLSFAAAEVARSLHSTEVGQPHDYGGTPLPQEKTEKTVKKLRLIKKVEPVYPEEALEEGLEDTVVVEGTTDTEGNVVDVTVLKGEHDILNQAALEAVRQWKYEPMKIDGKAIGIFTVTCRFRKDPKKKKDVTVKSTEAKGDETPPVYAIGDIKAPRLIKRVEPVYPDEAKKGEIEGVVIIEATTNTEGDVIDTTILRSVPGLDQAALEAIKQWKYEPMIINGKPKGIVFTVTTRFKLK